MLVAAKYPSASIAFKTTSRWLWKSSLFEDERTRSEHSTRPRGIPPCRLRPPLRSGPRNSVPPALRDVPVRSENFSLTTSVFHPSKPRQSVQFTAMVCRTVCLKQFLIIIPPRPLDRRHAITVITSEGETELKGQTILSCFLKIA
jgi:hypothetical protein